MSNRFHFVDGLQVPAVFQEDDVKSAMNYAPQRGDLFLVTYPKCGTTWVQHILILLFKNGEQLKSVGEHRKMTPFFEATGLKGVEEMERPGIIKIHLPFQKAPWSKEAKYIYVARNPKDCCVSYYYHEKNHGWGDTFDEFFESFINGQANFGDYFDHLIGWYAHRNDANMLFLTYEELKKNPEDTVFKMASFIDEERYAKPLKDNPQKLKRIVQLSSFDSMKETFQKLDADEHDEVLKETTERVTPGSEAPEDKVLKRKPRMSYQVRKGVTGDWRNHFSETQSKRIDIKFEEKARGTDILTLWRNYM